jgi:two-component system nitrogen regulation response regulator NtrX
MSIDILVVDDEKDIRLLIKGILEDEGYTVREADGAKSAATALEKKKPDLVILDIWLEGSGKDGLQILEEIKAENKHLPVLMISGHGTVETAVSAIKKGAYDFIEKPFKSDRLIFMIRRALENAQLKKENEKLKAKAELPDEFIGSSQAIQKVKQTLEKAANSSSRVLVTGEPGTGKNVAVRFLHSLSNRKDKPIVFINCAALHPERYDLELFGREGDETHTGAMDRANGGILYLDEVGDMPQETQSMIVRTLQEEKFRRVGGESYIPADIRIVASTNKNLEEEITKGTFREDLFYRLNVVPVHIPALRERPQDVPDLARYFINQCAAQSGLKPLLLSDEAAQKLQATNWPGNARQIKNTIEWVLIMHGASTDTIKVEHLPAEISGLNGGQTQDNTPPANNLTFMPLKEAREEFEKNYLLSQIRRFEGNISKTAEFIGMERSALHRKMKSLDISLSGKQDRGEGDDSPKTSKRA